jgi:membrane-bound serine protease (ClpP class)
MLQIVADAVEKAITQAASQGPLFILLEIDTPGGRIDLAQEICSAITKSPTPVYAFIKGGEHGGAISAGAAVAFACRKIYMANGTIIGAATLVTLGEGKVKDTKETYGKDIGEKYSSAWRGYLASLAERNGRPGLLARAMVDRETEVIEVNESGERQFIDPVNRKPGQQVVHTWNKKGKLLTLTAKEAIESGAADKEVGSREELLADVNASNAQIIIDDAAAKAALEFKKVTIRANELIKDIDLKSKEITHADTAPIALKILREAETDFTNLAKLAKKYPDMQIKVSDLEEQINSIKAASKDIKIKSHRRTN